MKSIAPFLVAAATCACATPAPAPPADEALAEALLGVWCNASDGGRSCWAYDEFTPDGKFEACGRTDDDMKAFRGTGDFSVAGQRMCYVVRSASPNFWLPPGARYCTDILAIDGRTHRYRDIDTQQTFTLYRIASGRKTCP